MSQKMEEFRTFVVHTHTVSSEITLLIQNLKSRHFQDGWTPWPLLKQWLNHICQWNIATISIIYQPYMYQMLSIFYQYLTHISSNQGHISVIQIWEKHKNPDLPPLSGNSLHFELWTFWFLVPLLNSLHLLGCFFKDIFWFNWVWFTIC